MYKAVTASGFAVLALSFAVLAPALPQTGPGAPPLSALPPAELNSVSAVMVAMGLKGVGSALSNNAVYPDMVLLLPPDKMTRASASGLWNAAYSLGWALGPLLGRLPSAARSAPPPPASPQTAVCGTGGLLYEASRTAHLCVGHDKASCDAGSGDADGASVGAGEVSPSRGSTALLPALSFVTRSTLPALQAVACECEWAPHNGFDSMAMIVAAVSAVYGVMLLGACLLNVGALPPSARALRRSLF